MTTALPACDRTIAHAAPAAAPVGAGHPRMLVATTVLASSMAFIDGSVVNVALPAIARTFADHAIGLSWGRQRLPASAERLLLTGGATGDRFGHRRLLMSGVALFMAASVLCASAPTLGWLLRGGRVLQGVGATMLTPTSLAILGGSFSGEARGRAIGTGAAAGAAAGAVGPLVGGWLIDAVGWRSIFLINVPIGAGALFLGTCYVQDLPDRQAESLDGAGALLATAGLAALTWGLTSGAGPGGWRGSALAGATAGVLLLLLFLVISGPPSSPPASCSPCESRRTAITGPAPCPRCWCCRSVWPGLSHP